MLFYVPYRPNAKKASASQLRPLRMLEAFRSLGEVSVIWGSRRERAKSIAELRERIRRGERFDYMYAESSTSPSSFRSIKGLPFISLLDGRFLAFCRRKGIVIGLFYRDIYWNSRVYRFDSWLERREMAFKSLFFKLDLRFYRKSIAYLFLPSSRMHAYIPELGDIPSQALPAGLELPSFSPPRGGKKRGEGLTIVYVGGIDTELYDLRLIFGVVKSNPRLRLIACFRPQEWGACEDAYAEYLCERIEVVHYAGGELQGGYDRADLACLFLRPVPYRDFAMPYKLFEYFGQLLPMLAVQGTASGDFVEENDLGWALPYEAEALSGLLIRLVDEPEELEKRRGLMLDRAPRNTWQARARLVLERLAEVCENPLS